MKIERLKRKEFLKFVFICKRKRGYIAMKIKKQIEKYISFHKRLKELDKLNKIYDMLYEEKQEMLSKSEFFPEVKVIGKTESIIDKYWTEHTVRADQFLSIKQSLEYCNRRFDMYPFFREMACMDKNHDGEVLLDYGCGPGNDLIWYTSKNSLKKIIGMDVSSNALYKASLRVALHRIPKNKITLYQLDNETPSIPLEDESIDFVSCQGVLQHTEYPHLILKEFHRVLKKREDFNCCVMVYNKESIWYHLYAAWYLRFYNSSMFKDLSDQERKNLTIDEIFRRSTDGVNCPKADCYSSEEFEDMCKKAGFSKVKFIGGYPNKLEIEMLKKYKSKALKDRRLEEEHKSFLRQIIIDGNSYPMINNKYCCIGGVYHLYK